MIGSTKSAVSYARHDHVDLLPPPLVVRATRGGRLGLVCRRSFLDAEPGDHPRGENAQPNEIPITHAEKSTSVHSQGFGNVIHAQRNTGGRSSPID
jgi:hypothetical protein